MCVYVTYDTISAESPTAKANLLNSYFSSCFSIPPSQTSTFVPTTPLNSYPNLSTIECTQEEVETLLSSLKVTTSTGPDEISSHMLKKTAFSISSSLHELFNLSLPTGHFPTDWKTSSIIPVFKSGAKGSVSNYTPISLLSIPSKLLEHIVHNRLQHHLITNSILSPRQFGFRPGSSTQEALLTATHDNILLYQPLCTSYDSTIFQLDMDLISNWILSSGLLIISRCHTKPQLSITMNSTPVTIAESVKYLGVTIAPDLKWNTHITNTCKSAKQKLGLLYRNFHLADQKTLSQLYKALVLPKLDYCSCVWDPPPSLLQISWSPSPPHPNPRTHLPHTVHVPFARTASFQSSFFVSICKLWNSLPEEVVTLSSSRSFKTALLQLPSFAL